MPKSGGTTFGALCRGTVDPNYACDSVINLREGKSLEKAKDALIELVEENLSTLKEEKGRNVKEFYIGKTYVQKHKRRSFDPMDPGTWRKDGISNRWRFHKKKSYGKDGLVVLAVVDREAVPSKCRGKIHQELYALALEQQLLHHFMIEDPDDRIANETFSTGRTEKKSSIGHAIYMTYTLAEKKEKRR